MHPEASVPRASLPRDSTSETLPWITSLDGSSPGSSILDAGSGLLPFAISKTQPAARKRRCLWVMVVAAALAAAAATAVVVTRHGGTLMGSGATTITNSTQPTQVNASIPQGAFFTWGGNNERNKLYLNAGLDPVTVASVSFGRRATVKLPFSDPITAKGTDSVYAQPIVFPFNGTEYALIVTTGNNVYVIDGPNGTVVSAKNFGPPHRILEDPVFIAAQQSKDPDSGMGVCRDIVDFVGTVGTPVVDITTQTAYFFSITVAPPPNQYQRTMWFHAVDAITLVEKDGFPVTIAPTADNNPAMKFDPNYTYQRPGLLLSNGIVYGAFGGHCDLNQGFAGWLIGVDAKSGQILTAWSTVGISAVANGGGAIWQSGAGLALDDDGNIHLVTGTGMNPGNADFYTDTPATKSNIPPNLHESYVKFALNSTTRQARVVDFMTPTQVQYYDYQDFDYGAGAPVILPASLRGPNGERLSCTMDKPGRILVHRVNDLGGFAGGANASYLSGKYGRDNVLSVFDLGAYINATKVDPEPSRNGAGLFEGYFGTPAIWTAEAGVAYFYFAVKYGPMVVLEWNPITYSFDKVVGESTFSFSLRTADMNSMSGLPVITSLGMTPGSAVVWVTDVFNGLYALGSVPDSSAKIKTLYHDGAFVGGQISRFNIPGFSHTGSGLVYVPTNNGTLLIYGKLN
ncbi:hypothetical protein BC830DRAFT_1228793 [Chytriomyces sp. MP71]|nr:hypothetical protein BC830DRAFT_1228793 [Chytriomyces sp. MP71]